MSKRSFVYLAVTLLTLVTFSPGRVVAAGAGVGNIHQGTQTDSTYANSFAKNKVTNVFSTTQQTSCYTPEVPYTVNDGPNDGYSGESACNGAANTGEGRLLS